MNFTKEQHIGSRLRQKRLALRLSQAQMAKRLGISASYLNLIEHGRRRASAQFTFQAAELLQIPQSELEHGVAPHVQEDITNAALELGLSDHEMVHLRETSMQDLPYANLISKQRARIRQLEGRLKSYYDRVSYDDVLSTALHDVLSTVTSIRSMASILRSGEEVSAQWLDRFHRNIDEDGRRLAESAQSLAKYLSQTDPDGTHNFEYTHDQFWQENEYYIAEIENDDFDVDEFVAQHAARLSPDHILRLRRILHLFWQDAQRLPRAALAQHASESDADILAIANTFQSPVAAVLRRVSILPEMPSSGMVIIDNSGSILFAKPYMTFDPRLCWDGICPLWPIFDAMQSASNLVSKAVTLHHGPLNNFKAQAAKEASADFANSPYGHGVMRLQSRQDATPRGKADETLALGLRCRICPQQDCIARRSAPIYAGAQQGFDN